MEVVPSEIFSLHRELIIHIANFLDASWDDTFYDYEEEDNNGIKLRDVEYYKYNGNQRPHPLRNLYATCKSFAWMLELEFACVEDGEFYTCITTRNINGVVVGVEWHGFKYLTGYNHPYNKKLDGYYDHDQFASSQVTDTIYVNGKKFDLLSCKRPCNGPCKKYNQYSIQTLFEKGVYHLKYIINEMECDDKEDLSSSEHDCKVCLQLDAIQNIITEKYKDIEFLMTNRKNEQGNSILVAEKRALLYFKLATI